MKKAAAPLLAVSALLVSLAACANQPPKPAEGYKPDGGYRNLAHNCSPRCVVTVIVPSSCGSGIRVAPDPIVVKKGERAEITWNVTGRWQFDRNNGIFVHQGEKAISGQDRSSDGRTFKVVIQHGDPAAFKYDVNLVGPDGRPCQIDPVIVNW